MENKFYKYSSFVIALLAMTLIILTLEKNNHLLENFFREKLDPSAIFSLITLLITVLFSLFTLSNLRVIQKNPTTISISLLGFPRAGKTVYLTVLFDLLQRQRNTGIDFNPYGSETIERVHSDLNILAKQEWLSKTKQNEVFFYRAYATLKNSIKIFERKYKLEIADFAGENFDELNPSTEMWLHKSEFFLYVVQSDAIMMAIDISKIIDSQNSEVETLQNSYIAAIQILIEKKGVESSNRLKAPVTILFLKSDKLSSSKQEEEVLLKMNRLLEVCQKRCLSFNYFFVSSVGLTVDKIDSISSKDSIENPPKQLTPFNVTEPLIWVMKRLRSST